MPLPAHTTSLTKKKKKSSQTNIRLFFKILLNQMVGSVKVVEIVLYAAIPGAYLFLVQIF